MTEKLPLALFLMGPTASGKTDLAIRLRQKYPVEIISVDSALIYKDMDIGTAKPDAQELALAPHRLIDILDPSEAYSAADFRRDAINEMNKIVAEGKIPLLVGGTMLYYKALLEGLSPLPAADQEIRKQIEAESIEQGWQALHDQLREIDPVSAERIHPNDPQRLSRALEVYRISGKTLTELTQTKGDSLPFRVKQFAIAPKERKELQVRRAVLVGRRADRDHLEQAMVYALLHVGRKLEAAGLDVAFDVVIKAGLIDRHLAIIKARDLVLVDVDADDVVARFGHAGAGDEAHVAGAEDS